MGAYSSEHRPSKEIEPKVGSGRHSVVGPLSRVYGNILNGPGAEPEGRGQVTP